MITRRSLLSYTSLSAAAVVAGAGITALPAMAKGGDTELQRRRKRRRDKKERRRDRRR